jgi:hypothetical protein
MIETQTKKTRFTTMNIALISIFSALWIALNLTVAPLGFRLLGLPIIHSVIIFLTLLLVVWATGQFGAASSVGIIGSIIVLLAGGPLPVLGFAAASIIFDVMLVANHHRLNMKPYSLAIALLATVVCSYFAGVVNGIFFIPNMGLAFAVTVWGSWTIVGGIIGFAMALPIIGALERANVKKVKG